MEGLDCVNLLAFIQIAVAFNFGLFYLKEKNSLTDLHKNYQKDLRSLAQNTIDSATQTLIDAKSCEDHECRTSCAYLEQCLKKIMYLTDKGTKWDEYAFLGLYAGVYGLFCLFFIGLSGCQHEPFAQRYLLIIAEFFILSEILLWVRICIEEDAHVVKASAYRDIFILTTIICIGAVFAYFDWTFKVFPEFEAPFVASLIVVYFPIFVFMANAVYERCRVKWLNYCCVKKIEITQDYLKSASTVSSDETVKSDKSKD